MNQVQIQLEQEEDGQFVIRPYRLYCQCDRCMKLDKDAKAVEDEVTDILFEKLKEYSYWILEQMMEPSIKA